MYLTQRNVFRLVGIIVTALLLVPLFFAVLPVFASAYPQIVWVDRKPTTPFPDIPVDITFQVIDYYSSITNCSLFYWLNNTSVTYFVNPKIIEGDFKNGTFLAQIPLQARGTTVKYCLTVEDEIGYIQQSQNYSYIVLDDTEPPIILNVHRIDPIGSPILSSETVTITASITDDGCGVKNATLFFSKSEANLRNFDPYFSEYNSTSMTLTINGDYVATIPSSPNGTRVYYYVGAYDNAGNLVEDNHRYPYYVFDSTNDNLQININVKHIYTNNLTAVVEVSVMGTLMSTTNEPLVIWLDYSRLTPSQNFILLINATENRFFYQNETEYTIYLDGDPSDYPFDSYKLNQTFTIIWEQPRSLSSWTIITEPFANNVWSWHYKGYNVTDEKSSFPILINTTIIERNMFGDAFPLIALVILLFFLLGGTLLIDPLKLNERLAIILAIFIFMAGFYFTEFNVACDAYWFYYS
jgi:hypothetical protein